MNSELKISGGFEMATMACLWRHGVLLVCYGPTCTWHDDCCVTQKMTADFELTGKAFVDAFQSKGGERELPIVKKGQTVTVVGPNTFAKACIREGIVYTRTVE